MRGRMLSVFVRSCCWGKFSEATTTCAIAVISATINIIINITDRLIGAGDGGRSKDLSLYPSLFLGWLFAVVVVVVVVRVRKVEISVGNISRSVPSLVAKCGKQRHDTCAPPVRVYLAKNVPAMYGCVCVGVFQCPSIANGDVFCLPSSSVAALFFYYHCYFEHIIWHSPKTKNVIPRSSPSGFFPGYTYTQTQPVHLIAIPLYF